MKFAYSAVLLWASSVSVIFRLRAISLISVPQNQSRNPKVSSESAREQSPGWHSRRLAVSRVDFCVSSTDSEEQKETAQSSYKSLVSLKSLKCCLHVKLCFLKVKWSVPLDMSHDQICACLQGTQRSWDSPSPPPPPSQTSIAGYP